MAAYLDKPGLLKSWAKIKAYLNTALAGKKSTQNAVSDPAASGTGVEFISGISQDAQGVISPSKKTVRTMGGASADAAGSTGLVPAPASGKQAQFLRGDGTWQTPTNTKNTAGSTDSSSKLFLIGATSQAASPQTYSHDTAYVGTDGCLYSGGEKALTERRKINNKELSVDITLDADDIAQSAITETGVDSVDDALGSLSQQIANLQLVDYDSSDKSLVFRSSDAATYDSETQSVIINI